MLRDTLDTRLGGAGDRTDNLPGTALPLEPHAVMRRGVGHSSSSGGLRDWKRSARRESGRAGLWPACAQTGNLSTPPQHSHNFMFHPHHKATTWKAKPWDRLHAFVTGLSAIKTKLTAAFCLFGPYLKRKKERKVKRNGGLRSSLRACFLHCLCGVTGRLVCGSTQPVIMP